MVIVKLCGGLANQMFPYATGRRLSLTLGVQLKLDITGFGVYRERSELDFRQYGLNVFNIIESFATSDEINSLTTLQQGHIPAFFHKMFHNKKKRPKSFVEEKQVGFDPNILHLKGDIYLNGNWNSWRYFADIESIIRSDFSFKKPATGKNVTFFKKISSCNAVSLHIRRGDYANNPKTNTVHGTCNLDYYQKAMQFIADHTREPHFFLFSDDLNWVKDNLKTSFPVTVVDINGPLCGHEDMRLMSQCNHNIIANSGFSWWSAWLNPNPQKLVIAPKKWFKTDKYKNNTLIPHEWIKI